MICCQSKKMDGTFHWLIKNSKRSPRKLRRAVESFKIFMLYSFCCYYLFIVLRSRFLASSFLLFFSFWSLFHKLFNCSTVQRGIVTTNLTTQQYTFHTCVCAGVKNLSQKNNLRLF
jgi:hypothetical protein